VPDPGSDELGRLAHSLGRPRASLAAFSALPADRLAFLTGAIDAAADRNQAELDTALTGAFPRRFAGVMAGVLKRGTEKADGAPATATERHL
jgi:hypothetical protein